MGWSSYLAYAVAFVYVGVIWFNHHYLFERLCKVDLTLTLINLGDVYMAILWPAAVGKPESHALFAQGQAPVKRYLQNRGLDLNKDGLVTRAEAGAKVQKMLEKGLEAGHVFEAA